MSLVVTLSQQTGSQNCKNLYVLDTTGPYNVSTNPTGYGSPNYAVADVERLSVLVKIPHSATYTDPYEITGSDAQDIMNGTTNLDINSTVLDQSETEESALEDGAYYLLYIPFWTAVATISVTNGSTSATASTSLGVAPYAGINYMIIDGEYYGVTVSGTAVTLDREYIGSTASGVAFKAGFASRLVLKQICNAERCIADKIATLYNQSCNCTQIEKDAVAQKREDLYGANVMWDKEAYVPFQNIVDQLTAYCNDEENNCGCS